MHTQADTRTFIYTYEELYIAAVFCAAELQVSRQLKLPDLELLTFGLVSSANKLILGRWQGRQLGLARLLASAAKRNGASFTLNGVPRRAWGLQPQASLSDILRAMKDVAEFPSRLHLAASKIGAWPALMTGAQTTMSLGWIIRYLFDFYRALLEQCEFHHIAEGSSSEEELGEAKKRKIDQDQAQDERSNR